MSIELGNKIHVEMFSPDDFGELLENPLDIDAYERHRLHLEQTIGMHAVRRFRPDLTATRSSGTHMDLTDAEIKSVTLDYDLLSTDIGARINSNYEWNLKHISDNFGSSLRFAVAKSRWFSIDVQTTSGTTDKATFAERRTYVGMSLSSEKLRESDMERFILGRQFDERDPRILDVALTQTSVSNYAFKEDRAADESESD